MFDISTDLLGYVTTRLLGDIDTNLAGDRVALLSRFIPTLLTVFNVNLWL